MYVHTYACIRIWALTLRILNLWQEEEAEKPRVKVAYTSDREAKVSSTVMFSAFESFMAEKVVSFCIKFCSVLSHYMLSI